MNTSFALIVVQEWKVRNDMEAYLEDNRPTIDEVCESYDECNKDCPLYRFCHQQESEE